MRKIIPLLFILVLIMSACSPGKRVEPASLPEIASPTPVNTVSEAPASPTTDPEIDRLFEVVKNGDDKALKELLDKAPELIKTKDGRGRTLIYLAANNGRIKTAQFLFDRGADAMSRNDDGKTPLHGALLQVYKKSDEYVPLAPGAEMTKLLLSKGADVNAVDRKGMTPLHAAALRGCDESARLIIKKGAKINARDGKGRTPLFYARINRLKSREWEVESLLRKHGAKDE